MNKKIDIFLQQISEKIDERQALKRRLKIFLKEKNTSVFFRDGQLFFIKDVDVEDSIFISSSNNIIFNFDGNTINRIEEEYYLGRNLSPPVYLEGRGDFFNTSNNNNNNNNNNGNNGNG